MIKRIVHIENISVQGEKKQFQIKLPLNTKRLLQIHTTANVANLMSEEEKASKLFQPEIGWLWLRISEIRDVFFIQRVKLPLQIYNQTFIGHKPVDDFGNGTFWTQGKQEEFYNITANLDTNLFEGYYVDRTVGKLPESYKLRIYLTIQL